MTEGISKEKIKLTQEYIRNILDYDHNTGIVKWKIAKSRMKPGEIAGYKTSYKGNKSYLVISVDNKKYKLHRIIWLYVYGVFPSKTIDHINGDGCDNRISNIRDVDMRTNSLNRKLQSDNSSGIHGVSWHINHKKWQVAIYDSSGYKYLGRFDNIFDAACARKASELVNNYHPNHGK